MDRSSAPAPNAHRSWTVRFKGATGLLQIDADGNVVYQAANSTTAVAEGCCLDAVLPVQVFPLSEVIGADQIIGTYGVRIWHCQLHTSGSASSFKRKFKLRKSDVFECESHDAAQQVVSVVQRAASWCGQTTPRRVVAVVNPVSGQGKGRAIFSEMVLPLLRDVAGMQVEVHTTTGKGHASQLLRSLDLSQADVLLYVGGDGTVFEAMQGLMSRPDWHTAVKVPFATVPTGSGNGLAASLGMWDPVTAAYAVCKRQTTPIDVASVLQPPSSRYYLVLSVAYGMMANLDIGTENLRWMGEPRFTVGGIRELLSGRFYPLRAALWPADEPVPGELSINGGHIKNNAVLGSLAHPTKLPIPSRTAPSPSEHNIKEPLLGADSSASQDLNNIPVQLVPSNSQLPTAHRSSDGTGTTIGLTSNPDIGLVLGGYPGGPPLPILSQFVEGLPIQVPQCQDQLPAGWRVLPEQVASQAQYFMLHNTTHLALNAPLNPKGVLSDGVWELIHLSGMKGWDGRAKGMQLLLNSDTGKHVDLEWVKTEKVRALILEPLAGDTTWMVLDGEQVPNDRPIYVEVHPRLCCALVAPGWVQSS